VAYNIFLWLPWYSLELNNLPRIFLPLRPQFYSALSAVEEHEVPDEELSSFAQGHVCTLAAVNHCQRHKNPLGDFVVKQQLAM